MVLPRDALGVGAPVRVGDPVRSGVADGAAGDAVDGVGVGDGLGVSADGVVLEVSRVDRFDKRGPLGPNNGGLSVSLL
ncbi:M23 family peptidase, partial [Micromonospora echinospora]